MWNEGVIPQHFKNTSIVKRKDNRQSCDNYHGISLLSMARKIHSTAFSNILRRASSLKDSVDSEQKEELYTYFRPANSKKMSRVAPTGLFVTFVDLTEAIGTVSRDGSWQIMERFGCPSKFIPIIRQFHDGIMHGQSAGWWRGIKAISCDGVKQGCVLAPTLFSMVFSAMLINAFHDCNEGIHTRYETNGGLYKPKHL